jgi:cytochrome c5
MTTRKCKLRLACAVGATVIASAVGVSTGEAAFQARSKSVTAGLVPLISVAQARQGGEGTPTVGMSWRMHHSRAVREMPHNTTPDPYIMQDPGTPEAERPLPDPHAVSNGG